MRTIVSVLSLACLLAVAACSQSAGQGGTTTGSRIPTGPEPGSPAAGGPQSAPSSVGGVH